MSDTLERDTRLAAHIAQAIRGCSADEACLILAWTLLASSGTTIGTMLNEGGGTSSIDCNRFSREGLTERFGNPFGCREVLAKDDSAVILEPFVRFQEVEYHFDFRVDVRALNYRSKVTLDVA
jgi:hypothetical protein